MNLKATIEALLFFKGDTLGLKEISNSLKADIEQVREALKELQNDLSNRGIRVVLTENEAMLGTAPELSSLFETLRKEELQKELSKASLETLSIILYKDLATRTEINFIRGVNSSFILRNLEVRGLIEKTSDKNDLRASAYKPTAELLAYLGVSKREDLPEFESVKDTILKKLLNQNEENENI
jgi:segregation and condensation protein B